MLDVEYGMSDVEPLALSVVEVLNLEFGNLYLGFPET